ncbi:hypothetical protein B0T26DRAFT_803928 [Lasiosphaeria miniovina]|uniref:Uncharacterized protein n=1 Tax=Lasiosphaeria miniovina TaxID=1954250 RepID=A0AA40ABU1_9PEZI|nr:uncharacterized protein B0T26DRAFT_803928 [Lasiosphaeria miniovina]KAK0713009.1 hypothetical protein B0T26DRAFT_803928 [Lasiosphaeria miniovina]
MWPDGDSFFDDEVRNLYKTAEYDGGIYDARWPLTNMSLVFELDKILASVPTRYRSSEETKGRRGPRPLLEMALDVLIDNMAAASADALAALPPKLLWRVWYEYRKSRVTFDSWKKFSKLVLADSKNDIETEGTVTIPLSLYHIRYYIKTPRSDLSVYTAPLLSPSVDFLVYLNIADVDYIQANELLPLAALPNLAVLEIFDIGSDNATSDPRVTDSLVRGWSDMPNAFPSLCILKVHDAPALSFHSLQYVSKFPALAFYDVQNWRSSRSEVDRDLARAQGQIPDGYGGNAPEPRPWGPQLQTSLHVLLNDNRVKVDLASRTSSAISPQKHHIGLLKESNALATVLRDGGLYAKELCYSSAAMVDQKDKSHAETWAFWALSIIDKSWPSPNTADAQPLEDQHIKASARGVRLPSRPVASLFLGEPKLSPPEDGYGGLFYRQLRPEISSASVGATREEQQPPQPKRDNDRRGTGLKSRKRQKIADVFAGFGIPESTAQKVSPYLHLGFPSPCKLEVARALQVAPSYAGLYCADPHGEHLSTDEAVTAFYKATRSADSARRRGPVSKPIAQCSAIPGADAAVPDAVACIQELARKGTQKCRAVDVATFCQLGNAVITGLDIKNQLGGSASFWP